MKRRLTGELQQELDQRIRTIEEGDTPDPMHVREWWLPVAITGLIVLFLYLVAAG